MFDTLTRQPDDALSTAALEGVLAKFAALR